MSLSPRYSLLTLLFLTALVAGGVKLWYGPHRVVMSIPPTAEEKAIQMSMFFGSGGFSSCPETYYDYDYANTFQGRQPILGVVREHASLPTRRYLQHARNNIYYLQKAVESLGKDNTTTTPEHVVSWIIDLQQSNLIYDDQEKVLAQDVWDMNSILVPSYFLSSERQLYLYEQGNSQLVFRVSLDHIQNPLLRARVAEEMASLPDPK